MNPRTFTDRDGSELTVSECCDDDLNPDCVHVSVEGKSVCLQIADLPAVVAALYEAAGKPAPVILEHTDPAISYSWMIPGAGFNLRDGGVEIISIGSVTDSGHLHDPASIRGLAARLAEMAEQAERWSGPSLAEVEELAKVIRSELHPASESLGLRPSESDRTAARAALRWMRDREAAP